MRPENFPSPRGAPPRRRFVLRLAGAAAVACGVPPRGAFAQASIQEQQIELDRDIARRMPGVVARPGRVRIDLPDTADNGNSVPCTLSVDSPMTAEDHVRELNVWAARNPRPWVASVQFGPANPRARLETRLRLGESQRVFAIASMSDGTHWSGWADVVVLVSACQDGSG